MTPFSTHKGRSGRSDMCRVAASLALTRILTQQGHRDVQGTGRLSPPASPPESALRPPGPSTGCGRFALFLPFLVPPSRDLRETRHPLWLSILPSLRQAKTFHGAVGSKVGIHAIVIRHGGGVLRAVEIKWPEQHGSVHQGELT